MNPEPDPAVIFRLERPGPALWKLYLIRSVLSGPAIVITLPFFYFRYQTLRYRFDEEGVHMKVGILITAVGHAAFSLAVVNLDYEKRWYLVTDRSLRIREGVAVVKEITFTFANIQNLSVSQGPIQRALGIADLKVETAGGGSGGSQHQQHPALNLHTAYFRGIDNAEEVKQLIATRMRGQRDAGLGDRDDVPNPAAGPADATAAQEAVLAEARALRLALEKRRDAST